VELSDPPIQWVPEVVLLEHEVDCSLSSNVKVNPYPANVENMVSS